MTELEVDMSVFWDRPFPVTLTGAEMRVLFTGAVRYAMHRGTGGSSMTAEAVRSHLADLDEGTLEIIARDVRRESGYGPVPYFEGLPDEIDAELERRRS